MSSFLILPALNRNLFQFWILMLCFADVICIVYAVARKQFIYAISALPCFAFSYFLRQVMLEVAELYLKGTINDICMFCGNIPWLWYFAAMVLLTVATAWILYKNIFFNKCNITPSSIKLCGDSMPCGICYWRDGGLVIFANACMSELCFRITNRALIDGEGFFDSITDPVMSVGDKVWSFMNRTVEFHGYPLHELIATEVTELYTKTAALKEETEEIKRYNENLRTYNLHIDEMVRQKEILQAKTNIHDEMNRLMLITVAAGNEDCDDVDRAFDLWQNNALLLCREAADDGNGGSIEELERIIKMLKMNLVWRAPLPESFDKKQRSLFFAAGQEAIANAFKHGKAKTMEIDFIRTDNGLRCDFINDGNMPEKTVEFIGGLANLKSLAEMQGAEVSVAVDENFTLSLFFLENSKNMPSGRCNFKK